MNIYRLPTELNSRYDFDLLHPSIQQVEFRDYVLVAVTDFRTAMNLEFNPVLEYERVAAFLEPARQNLTLEYQEYYMFLKRDNYRQDEYTLSPVMLGGYLIDHNTWKNIGSTIPECV